MPGWLTLTIIISVLAAMQLPSFFALFGDHGFPLRLARNSVEAYVRENRRAGTLEILMWSSLRPGHGNTHAALAELRYLYPELRIVAHDVTTLRSERYWRRMYEHGLVDSYTDAQGATLT